MHRAELCIALTGQFGVQIVEEDAEAEEQPERQLRGRELALGPGDTVVVPAGELRRFSTGPDGGFAAIVAGPADSRAALADGSDRGVPGWIV
ncbi:cupin domain-containing protein [Streptacidiphilus sp. PAMC 29251]